MNQAQRCSQVSIRQSKREREREKEGAREREREKKEGARESERRTYEGQGRAIHSIKIRHAISERLSP